MARLRDLAPETRRPVAPAIPEHLATWYVDDWIRDDETGLQEPSGASRTDLSLARSLVSRRRFLAAQEEWSADLVARGIAPPKMPRPGQPRHRPTDPRSEAAP